MTTDPLSLGRTATVHAAPDHTAPDPAASDHTASDRLAPDQPALDPTTPAPAVAPGGSRLRRLGIPIGDPRFWVIQVLVFAIDAGHSLSEEAGVLEGRSSLYLLSVSVLLIPLVYAALSFGLRGVVPTALWAGVLSLPEISQHDPTTQIGILIQFAILLVIGIIVALRVDRERAAAHASQEANRQLSLLNAENRDALRSLEAANQRLETYIALATDAQEEERKRLSRELHDDLLQSLVVAKSQIESASDYRGPAHPDRSGRPDRSGHPDRSTRPEPPGRPDRIPPDRPSRPHRPDSPAPPGQVWDRLASAEEVLGDAIVNVRRYCRDLRPSLLDDLGLVDAVEWLVGDLRSRTGLDVHVETHGSTRRLTSKDELLIFRIVQEALHNIERHAGARHARVRLAFTPAALEVSVADDGQGFSPGDDADPHVSSGAGLGLRGMGERTKLLRGRLEIHGIPGRGTELTLVVPLVAPGTAAPPPS